MISRDDIAKLAGLSRIHISEAEAEKFSEDIGRILDYIKKLDAAGTEDVSALSSVTGSKNIMRSDADELHVPESEPEALLDAAPATQDRYVKVRSVWN